MVLESVKISRCAAVKCAYNKGRMCHALAVTIGSSHQQCDTYMEDTQKGGVEGVIGTVGACHMKNCRFNEQLECAATEIEVGAHSQHGDCSTFQMK